MNPKECEWYAVIDCDLMEVGDFASMLGQLKNIGYTDKRPWGNYSVGTYDDDEIQIRYDRGSIELDLNQIYGEDMPAVIGILLSYRGLRVECLFHETGLRPNDRFSIKFDNGLFEPQFLNEFCETVKKLAGDYAMAWNIWLEESGFNAWVKEVYDNDE